MREGFYCSSEPLFPVRQAPNTCLFPPFFPFHIRFVLPAAQDAEIALLTILWSSQDPPQITNII